jgi:hypothetical protein
VGAFAGLLAPLVAGIATLVKRIVFPTIVAFPWDDDHRADAVDSTSRQPSASNTTLSPWRRLLRTRQEEDREKVVVLAGSFNPIHKGHVSMLEYLARRYVVRLSEKHRGLSNKFDSAAYNAIVLSLSSLSVKLATKNKHIALVLRKGTGG